MAGSSRLDRRPTPRRRARNHDRLRLAAACLELAHYALEVLLGILGLARLLGVG